jgi:nicotinate-nucleotide pyrophosphorylase (carboxylating)
VSPAEIACADRLIELALAEDLGDAGDVTSLATIPEQLKGKAAFVPRAKGTLAGLDVAERIFKRVDPKINFTTEWIDGDPLEPGEVFATIAGSMRSILAAERTALNFLQHLSGIATLTAQYRAVVSGLPVTILDTRKTIPGWRLLEKYAVRAGGGTNHRVGLYDMVLIKDNHLAATRNDIAVAIERCRAQFPNLPVEVEVESLEQLDVALRCQPDIVLLDNMPLDRMREAVARRNSQAPGVLLEASGGVNLQTVRLIAETGVDRISVGALTHSAKSLDIALDYTP